MGHPTDIFLKKPDDSIICAICLEVLRDPASFKECGHTFCEDCIKGCLSNNRTCPTCRVSVHTGSNPTYILRDLVGKLEVRCPNSLLGSDSDNNSDNGSNNPPSKRLKTTGETNEIDELNNNESGCDWKGTIGKLDQHLADECPLTTIECGEEGCKHTCQRRRMAAHKSSQQGFIAHMKLGFIAHMKLKHQNELTAIKLEYEDKLAAMKKKYEKKCERMNRRIVELEEKISVDPSDEDSDFSGRGNGVVKEIMVEGAGLQEVNGTYSRSGLHDGVAKFVKTTIYNRRPVNFMLFRCKLLDGTRRWYISIVPEDVNPGTTQDIDFYAAHLLSSGIVDHSIPPRDGWIAIPSNGGSSPPPTVYPKGSNS